MSFHTLTVWPITAAVLGGLWARDINGLMLGVELLVVLVIIDLILPYATARNSK